MGIAAIQIQVQPWVVATKASDTIITQIEQALPPTRLGVILHVVGAPDNYHGAYINRLGIDMALLIRKQQFYIDWPEKRFMPMPYQTLKLNGDFFQVEISSNEQQQRWEVARVRGVTVDTPLLPFPPTHWIYGMGGGGPLIERLARQLPPARPSIQAWDPQDCQQVLQWQVTNLTLDCRPGEGTLLTPETGDPMLIMPGVRFKTDRWTEVLVTIKTLRPSKQAIAQVFWGNQANGFDESHSVFIEIPDMPRRQSYHFFIPPTPNGKGATNLA